eukprot:3581449-Rhodomonas_salina.2
MRRIAFQGHFVPGAELIAFDSAMSVLRVRTRNACIAIPDSCAEMEVGLYASTSSVILTRVLRRGYGATRAVHRRE